MYPPRTGKSQVEGLGLETTCPNSYNRFRPPIGANVRILSHIGSLSSDVLLTVHLSIFISLFNQLDAQNLFHNKFYFILYMFRAHVLKNM